MTNDKYLQFVGNKIEKPGTAIFSISDARCWKYPVSLIRNLKTDDHGNVRFLMVQHKLRLASPIVRKADDLIALGEARDTGAYFLDDACKITALARRKSSRPAFSEESSPDAGFARIDAGLIADFGAVVVASCVLIAIGGKMYKRVIT